MITLESQKAGIVKMIPKIIHYCWFGRNPLPEDVKKNIASWKKYCPDYEIIEWNEDNFDLSLCNYIQDAYKEKKWAFITDYVRLYVLVQYGGIYMDSDVEIIKNLDPFLKYPAFSGFQTEDSIPTGIMASEKGFHLFRKLLDEYKDRSFYNSDGSINNTTNVVYITNACLKRGLVLNNKKQNIDGFYLFPQDYFCAKSYETGKITITNNTYTIHHFAGSWFTNSERKKAELRKKMINKFGRKLGLLVYYAIGWPLKVKIWKENRTKKYA